MPTEHHDFVFLVGAGNFSNGVPLRHRVIVEIIFNIERQLDILLLIQQPRDSAPMLSRQRDLRKIAGLTGLVGSTLLYKYSSAANRAPAVVDQRHDFLILKKLEECSLGTGPARKFSGICVVSFAGNLVLIDSGE